MVLVADTSALYALYDTDDAHHAEAHRLAGQGEPIVIPREILVEFAHLLAYRASPTFARDALLEVLDLPHVTVADPVPIEGVVALLHQEPRLSAADAIVVQTCRVLGAQPLTFDAVVREVLMVEV